MAYNFIKTPPKPLPEQKQDIPDLEELLNGMNEAVPQDAPAPLAEETTQPVEVPVEETPLPAEAPAPDAATTVPDSIEEPVPEETPAPSPKPATPKKTKTTKRTGQKKPSRKAADDDGSKEKCSIYLPEDLSLSLRMASVLTRQKNSYIAEVALRDLMHRRYQCQNPACYAKFSVSETDDQPSFCPMCGGDKVDRFFIDR